MTHRLLPLMIIAAISFSPFCMADLDSLFTFATAFGIDSIQPLSFHHLDTAMPPARVKQTLSEEEYHYEAHPRENFKIPAKLEKQQIYRKDDNGTLYRVWYNIVDGKVEQTEEAVSSWERQMSSDFFHRLDIFLSRNRIAIVTEDEHSGELIITVNKPITAAPDPVVLTTPKQERKIIQAIDSDLSDFSDPEIPAHSSDEDYDPILDSPPRKVRARSKKHVAVKRTHKGKINKPQAKNRASRKTMQKPVKLFLFASRGGPGSSRPQSSATDGLRETCQLHLNVCFRLYKVSSHKSDKELLAEASAMGIAKAWFSATELPRQLANYGLTENDWNMLMAFYELVRSGGAIKRVKATLFFDWLEQQLNYNEEHRERGHLSLRDAYIDLCLQYTALVFNTDPRMLYPHKDKYLHNNNPIVLLQRFAESSPEADLEYLKNNQLDFLILIASYILWVAQIPSNIVWLRHELDIALRDSQNLSADSFLLACINLETEQN